MDVRSPRETSEEGASAMAAHRSEYGDWVLRRFTKIQPEMAPEDGRR